MLADGDLVTAVDELGQVVVQRMVRNAGHRHPLPLSHLAGCEDDVQLPRGDPGIIIEGLVEVAEAKEDNGVGISLLDLKILLSERCYSHLRQFYYIR